MPVLAVRSYHLPHDHTPAAVQHYAADHCRFRGECVLEVVGFGAHTGERRWRHAQLVLCGCTDASYATRREAFFRSAPTLSVLRRDVTAALQPRRQPLYVLHIHVRGHVPDGGAYGADATFLDPVRLTDAEVPASVLSLSCRCVAAYIVHVGAKRACVAQARPVWSPCVCRRPPRWPGAHPTAPSRSALKMKVGCAMTRPGPIAADHPKSRIRPLGCRVGFLLFDWGF